MAKYLFSNLQRFRAFGGRILGLLLYMFDNRVVHSYYPDEHRKSGITVFCEKLLWLIRNGGINRNYYAYGFDIKGKRNQKDYISPQELIKVRRDCRSKIWIGHNRADYVCLVRDKFVFSLFLQGLNVPSPRVLALGEGECLKLLGEKRESTFSEFVEYMKPEEEVFIKPLDGTEGSGVFCLKKGEGLLFIDNDKQISKEKLQTQLPPSYIIQEKIVQHAMLNKIYPYSVNTIRLVTVNKNGNIQLFSALLRIGSGGSFVDNLAAGGIMVGINKNDGILMKEGYFGHGYGKRVIRHPDSEVIFEDYKIPFFHDAVDLVFKTHKYFYGVRSIGWDIAISEDGPLVIEGNDDWNVSGSQILYGGLKNKILSEVY